ncbi:MAG TPA: Flp pilus assembly protein CpaB [Xanthobacteraceae bacterium]|nr:Flp pilus assembly protein CpaB [Xanthobacteraceae bacterium]
MRTSTLVMIGFAVLFGLLAVFLAQTWLNDQEAARMRSLDANRKAPAPERTIVVASRPLRYGEPLTASALRELPWPADALPAGAFAKIADLTASKRVVLMPIETNEAVLASRITGPGERATLSAVLDPGMTAVTVRVNDVQGVAGFVLPGDHVDLTLTRQGEKNAATTDVVIEDAQVLAIDQVADAKTDKPSVVKAVTLEVKASDGEKIALASTVGTLSLLLRKAGDVAADDSHRITPVDLVKATRKSDFATVAVSRLWKNERTEYSVPVEHDDAHSAALSHPAPVPASD